MKAAQTFEGRKFMWDGKTYQNQSEAEEVGQKYRSNGFEVELIVEEGQHFLFTRRVVTEVIVEGKPS